MILVLKNMNSNTNNNNNNITLLCRLHSFVLFCLLCQSPKPTIPQNLPNPRYPLATLLILLPLMMSRGIASRFHNVSTHGGKVIEY